MAPPSPEPALPIIPLPLPHLGLAEPFDEPSNLNDELSTPCAVNSTLPPDPILTEPVVPFAVPHHPAQHDVPISPAAPISTDPTDRPNIYETQSNSDLLVTHLTNTLSREEKLLLSKGPKFALSQPVNDNTRRDATVSFCRLANELRWKEHWRRKNTTAPANGMPKYP